MQQQIMCLACRTVNSVSAQSAPIFCGNCGHQLAAPTSARGSDLARAVAKGIKQKEQESNLLGCLVALFLIGGIAAFVVTLSGRLMLAVWALGIIVCFWAVGKYYKE